MTKPLKIATCAVLLLAAACAPDGKRAVRPLIVFHASNMTALFDTIRDDLRREKRLELRNEASGSQVVCRKVSELGRQCDLIVLADPRLVGEILGDFTDWRLDFAADEMVLAVGARAPHAGTAEHDWPRVLLKDDVRLGRVKEYLGPTGYRTLLVWKLQERISGNGLHDKLLARTDKLVEHVTQIVPLLKTGEIDYAFVYRSLCLAWDIRFIPLDPRISLGDPRIDYSHVETTFKSLTGESEHRISGSPILYTLTIPVGNADYEAPVEFIRYLLGEAREVMRETGYIPLDKARFYGNSNKFAYFKEIAVYAGEIP